MSGSLLYTAALDLQAFCEEQAWHFCIIGGLAVQRWGVQRYTKDADLTLRTELIHDEEYTSKLPRAFCWAGALMPSISHSACGLQTRVHHRSIKRASRWRSGEGAGLITCSAEDLVVHKAFAGREDDWSDVDGILEMRGAKLDHRLIFEELRPLAALKEDDGIVTRLEWLFKKHGLR